jgi:glucose/arabinose dehydrogenase
MKRLIVFYALFLIISIEENLAQPPYGLTKRIPNTSLLISSEGDTLAEMELRQVFSNLSFNLPVFLTNAHDGSDRIFVVERRGAIRVFANDDTVTTYKTFIDISYRVNSAPNEAGMLSLAFHPQYPDSNKCYIYYTYDSEGDLMSRVSEFRISPDPNVADTSSERIVFEVLQPRTNHNGGQLAFGPDGYLYLGLGDGGGGGDPWGNAQNRINVLGKILRIDIDNYSDTLGYSIPSDNPFVDNTDNWREEIWAWGLRNPWRFSFDHESGDLWAGDVGQGSWEEVDLIEKGKNYGWDVMEGFHCYEPASDCDTSGLTLPVVEYSHTEGFSITGGYVYRGNRIDRLQGVYLYGDYSTRTIWGLKYENGTVIENKIIAQSPGTISSFGEDESGDVYVISYNNGNIYLFEEKEGIPPANTVPKSISQSGLFSNLDSLIISPGLIPYSVNSQFWSDGAYKTRVIALPDTSQIIFSQEGNWFFPPNAVIVKNFFLELETGNPESRKIVETRFLVRHAEEEQWDGYSYMWNEAGTDADLLQTSTTGVYNITDGDSTYQQQYYFPSRSECLVCHTPEPGYVLGLKTAQINKQHLYYPDNEPVSDNQLRSYNHIRLFTEDIDLIPQTAKRRWRIVPGPILTPIVPTAICRREAAGPIWICAIRFPWKRYISLTNRQHWAIWVS